MQAWVPYLVLFVFLLIGVVIKALSRSGDLKFTSADWNVAAPAAASGVLIVVNSLLDKPSQTFTSTYNYQLGLYTFITVVTLVISLFIARAADQESKNSESAQRSVRVFVAIGPFISIFLATLCLGLAVTLK
jgi:L-lactate permease